MNSQTTRKLSRTSILPVESITTAANFALLPEKRNRFTNMPPSRLEKARMNSHLRAHGLGSLDDPSILEQLAFFVRSHETFRNMLAKLPPDQRQVAYSAMAPRMTFFKPRTLADYEVEIHKEAESLPIIDHKTLAVTMPGDAKISNDMREAITGKTLEERRDLERVQKAEDAIAEDLGQAKAKGRLEIACTKCGFTALVYAEDRADAYLTLIAAGWKVSGENAYCPTCGPQPKDNH